MEVNYSFCAAWCHTTHRLVTIHSPGVGDRSADPERLPTCSVMTGSHHRLLRQNGTLAGLVFFSKGGQTEKRGLYPNLSIKELGKKTKKTTKDGQQESSFVSQGGERWQTEHRQSDGRSGNYSGEQGLFFPARTNMLFGNVVILQQKLNPPHYARPTRSSRLAASKQARALLAFYPLSTLGRRLEFTHFKPSPQPNNSTQHPAPPPPSFFSARDKARGKDARGARDELAQIVSKRLVCLGYLEVVFPSPPPPSH